MHLSGVSKPSNVSIHIPFATTSQNILARHPIISSFVLAHVGILTCDCRARCWV